MGEKMQGCYTEEGTMTPEYIAWRSMKNRCYAPSVLQGRYKKNNIQVCERWINSFPNFLEDMGLRPSDKHSLDRIDNTSDYSPSNCRWATKLEQSRNTSGCIYMSYKGETKTLSEWAEFAGINYYTFRNRIKMTGMTLEEALFRPIGRHAA